MRRTSFLVLVILLCQLPSTAFAYIGPGLGAGALGVVIGVVGSIFLALFAVLYYPIKRFFKRRRANSTATEDSDEMSG